MNIEQLWAQEDLERGLEVFNKYLRFVDFEPLSAGTKIALTIASTAVTVGVQMYGQAQQAKAAKGQAAYNASLNRMDMEQNNRNRDIERHQDKKRFYLTQESAANKQMPMDFLFADLESFEYNALVKDYNVAQANTSLEARARGGIYQGNVKAANLQNQMVGTALGGAQDAFAKSSEIALSYPE